MKRSEALKALLPKVISPFEVINFENFQTGVYHARAEAILSFIEKEIGMLPPIEPHRRVEDLDLGAPDWEPED